MEDGKIIDLFFERSEQAIALLSEKYGRLCLGEAENILADKRDAEECVNDAYLAVWNAIPPERPKYLSAYVLKIVRNISLNRLKRNSAMKRGGRYEVCLDELSECLPSDEDVEAEYDARELAATINDFVSGLSALDRRIFIRRYWFMDDNGAIASLTGLKVGAVRTRLSRLRRELKNFLEKRGVY